MEKFRTLVENYYGLDLNLSCRKKVYVEARAIYYYLCFEFTQNSVLKISRSVGKTHATVLHALKEIPYMRKYDSNFNENFYELYEIAKNYNKEEKTELTLKELVTNYNRLKIDNEVLKQRLAKYE